jgi:hypothetical protein
MTRRASPKAAPQTATAVEMFDRRARTAQTRCERIDLDDVDLGRQVRGNLEADFLLTHCGLGPGLHG